MQRFDARRQQLGDQHVHRKKLDDERNIAVHLNVCSAQEPQNRVIGKAHDAHDGAEHHRGNDRKHCHANRVQNAV